MLHYKPNSGFLFDTMVKVRGGVNTTLIDGRKVAFGQETSSIRKVVVPWSVCHWGTTEPDRGLGLSHERATPTGSNEDKVPGHERCSWMFAGSACDDLPGANELAFDVFRV